MAEPGFGDGAVDDLLVDGAGSRAKIRNALRAASYTRRIDGGSELQLELHDPERRIMRDSELFRAGAFVELGRLRFDMVGYQQGDSTFTVLFEDAVVGRLRAADADVAVSGGKQRRSEFAARLLADAGVDSVVQPDDSEKVQFSRTGGEEGESESSWEALDRLAREASREDGVSWRRFSTGWEVVFASDAWLMDRYEAPRVRESTAGVVRINWTIDRGRERQRATVRTRAEAWSVPPGRPVRLVNQGPASGFWLIEQIRRTDLLASKETVLQLVRADEG